MAMINCFLCSKKIPNSEGKEENRSFDEQLTVFFLVNKILEVSSSKCAEFLEREGNPTNWFDCCSLCQDLVKDTESVCKKIDKLQNKRKSLIKKIQGSIVRSHNLDAKHNTGESDTFFDLENVSTSIRTEAALRFHQADTLLEEDDIFTIVDVKPEPIDPFDEDPDEAFLPPSPGEQNNGESDSNEDGLDENADERFHKCKACGKQYKYIKSFQYHVKYCKAVENIPDTPRRTRTSNSTVNSIKIKMESGSDSLVDQDRGRGSSSSKATGSSGSDNSNHSDKEWEESFQQSDDENNFDEDVKTKGKNTEDIVGKIDPNTLLPSQRYTCDCGKRCKTRACKNNGQPKRNRGRSVKKKQQKIEIKPNQSQIKPKKTQKDKTYYRNELFIVIKNLCLCNRKMSCKHKRNFKQYKQHCVKKRIDIVKKQQTLIAECEHELSKELGYYRCRLCRFGFPDKDTYGSHLIGYHQDQAGKIRFKCTTCKKKFIFENELQSHMESTVCQQVLCNTKENTKTVQISSKYGEETTNNLDGTAKQEPANELTLRQKECISDEDESICSSDEYELIDDDVLGTGEGEMDNKNTLDVPSENKESADDISSSDKRILEPSEQTKDGLEESLLTSSENISIAMNQSINCQPALEEKDKMRLFRTFRCLTCKKGFNTAVKLNGHIRRVHKARKKCNACHLCAEVFRPFSKLESHYRVKHGGFSISAVPVIEGGFEEHKYRVLSGRRKESLGENDPSRNGYVTSESDPDWDPENMKEYQPREKREPMKRRWISVSEYDPNYIYDCNVCGIKYDTQNSLVRHALYAHGEEVGFPEACLVHECDGCNKKYSTSGLLEAHKRVVHEERSNPYTCSLCRKEFKIYRCYFEHIKNAHKQNGPAVCSDCNVHFYDESFFNVHMRTIHVEDNKPHHCLVCQIGCRTDMELRYHYVKHVKRNEEIMCEFCCTMFLDGDKLNRHQIKHHFEEMGVEPIKCDQCGKIFGDKRNLNRHMQTVHIKDFKFGCTKCSLGFNKEESLNQHFQRRHLEGKTYLCSECPRSYWSISMLKKHEKKHHSGAPQPIPKFPCTLCTSKFKTEEVFQKHMARHSKMFECSFCSATFKNKSNCNRHMETIHKDVHNSSEKRQRMKRKPKRDDPEEVEPEGTKRKSHVKIKFSNKRKRKSPEYIGNDHVESSNNSSSDWHSVPAPINVPQPQPQIQVPASSYQTPFSPPRRFIGPTHLQTSSQKFDYGQSQVMHPQDFSLPTQRVEHSFIPNQTQNMQIPEHLFPFYSNPYQSFPHNYNVKDDIL